MLAIALGAVIAAAGIIVVGVLQLAIARANLGSFADLAALAAGQASSDPCTAAARISQLNSVDLVSCQTDTNVVEIVVRSSAVEIGLLHVFVEDLQVGARASRHVAAPQTAW